MAARNANEGETGELGRIALKRGDLFREQCYINGK